MLTSFFVLCDVAEKTAPELMSRPLLGGFLKGGLCASRFSLKNVALYELQETHKAKKAAAWVLAWPLEVVKNKVQSYEGAQHLKGQSTVSILRQVARQEGAAGLFRGLAPGAMRSFVANGAGMAVYQLAQSMRRN